MIKRVLVGVDFSEASRTALGTASLWARKLDVPVMAMHVLLPPIPMLPEPQIAVPDPAWIRQMENHAKEQLDKFVSDWPGILTHVKWGSPAEELVSEASPDCLLVVAQVGHSRIQRLLFGTTAARVVKHAPCDVLVVRAERSKKS